MYVLSILDNIHMSEDSAKSFRRNLAGTFSQEILSASKLHTVVSCIYVVISVNNLILIAISLVPVWRSETRISREGKDYM